MIILRHTTPSLLVNDRAILWWTTDSKTLDGHGLSVHVFGAETSTNYPAKTTFFEEADGTRAAMHQVEVSGLSDVGFISTQVYGPGFLETAIRTFHPPESTQDISLSVINSVNGNFTELQNLLDDADTDGVISCGGMMPLSAGTEDWETFFDATYGFFSSANAVLIGRAGADAVGVGQKLYRSTPTNKSYYSTNVGKIAIVVLDLTSSGRRSIADEQKAWAMNEFGSSFWKQASFRVILAGTPIRTALWDNSLSFGNGTGVDSYLHEHLLPLLKNSGADMVISGGAKSYQRGYLESSYQGNEGATISYIVCAGTSPHHNVVGWDFPPSDEPSIFVEYGGEHTVKLFTSGDLLSLHVVVEGTIIDQHSVVAKTL